MNINLGKSNAYFRIAANAVAQPGLYTLQFSKTGDDSNIYTAIPPLTLVVMNKKCTLTTDSISYSLPIGGSTLPIMIDCIQCIPITNITLQLAYSNP